MCFQQRSTDVVFVDRDSSTSPRATLDSLEDRCHELGRVPLWLLMFRAPFMISSKSHRQRSRQPTGRWSPLLVLFSPEFCCPVCQRHKQQRKPLPSTAVRSGSKLCKETPFSIKQCTNAEADALPHTIITHFTHARRVGFRRKGSVCLFFCLQCFTDLFAQSHKVQ